MRSWLASNWFLLSLFGVLAVGFTTGSHLDSEQRALIKAAVHPAWAMPVILFLMSIGLATSKLSDAFRKPAPVLWATLINLAFVPLLAWPLTQLQTRPDLAGGLFIAAIVPCTLATATVWTRKAGGNEAVSMMTTLASNILGVITAPLWLQAMFTLGGQAPVINSPAASSTLLQPTLIDPVPMMIDLSKYCLLPMFIGQLARQHNFLMNLADRFRTECGILAQVLVLSIVGRTALDAGGSLGNLPASEHAWGLLVVATTCAAVHLVAFKVATFPMTIGAMHRETAIACGFAASQKTLPVALLLATIDSVTQLIPGPLITLPILMYHAIQLITDTIIAQKYAHVAALQQVTPATNTPCEPVLTSNATSSECVGKP